jgi:putative intracellular protease/amidase
MAEYSFANAPQFDIMMVPGGRGTRVELNNAAFLDFIRQQDRKTTLTTSVCTGSALLAKAGLLKGRKATSNKNGVSAGTDMALGVVARIVGKEHAGHLARDLEYQWNDDAANDPFAIAEPHGHP